MDVQVSLKNCSIPVDSSSVKILVQEFLAFHNLNYDEAGIHFVDTQTICDLHQQFFNDPSPTDCISFPMDDESVEGYRILGEVFVCPEVAADYVKEHLAGGNAYNELTLYVTHGLLHLIGYDDIEEEEQKEMRREETRFLEHVAEQNLWIKN